METQMFCFQCEQTAQGKGCTGKMGVCGKLASTAGLQDALTGALVSLARAVDGGAPTQSTHKAMLEALFTTVTNVDFDDDAVCRQIEAVRRERDALAPNRGGEELAMHELWDANEDIRSLKSLILFGLRGMAAYAYHAMALGYQDEALNLFFYEGLRALADPRGADFLLPMTLKVGEMNLRCMALLDRANTETYGTPVPTTVPLSIEKGPFIVVSGHDLHDLKLLLAQTEGRGVNVYTHGEMLPAHAYPQLKAYPHLKGNFGTAWQSQQKEFADLPAPVLFTTNCLMPVKDSYRDRVFTTAVVAYPGMAHIGEDKDFSPVIEKALQLGGYPQTHAMTGINGGAQVTTGFGHGTVLGVADKVIGAVKSGAIRHFFLVGGCDGAKPGRNYYTEFVKQAPGDTMILTLACGKYRFNDLDLGEIGGLPRILDMGQCNDAYSAIRVAIALAEAFGCGVNDLPLSMILSWYEQKAVVILLTLLHLGIRDIRLGPTLPAFVSPGVLKILIDTYGIKPISTPQEDLRQILG